MTWGDVATGCGLVALSAGTVFTAIAAAGIVRFRTLLQRQHAATKPQMLGFLLIMVGVMLIQRTAMWTGFGLLAIALQMLTAPLGAHILARAALGRESLSEGDGEDEDDSAPLA